MLRRLPFFTARMPRLIASPILSWRQRRLWRRCMFIWLLLIWPPRFFNFQLCPLLCMRPRHAFTMVILPRKAILGSFMLRTSSWGISHGTATKPTRLTALSPPVGLVTTTGLGFASVARSAATLFYSRRRRRLCSCSIFFHQPPLFVLRGSRLPRGWLRALRLGILCVMAPGPMG